MSVHHIMHVCSTYPFPGNCFSCTHIRTFVIVLKYIVLKCCPMIVCRFVTAEGTSKNRVIGPTSILHFYNAPPDAKEETLRDVFVQSGAVPPPQTKFFSQGGKSCTGLMQWPTVEVALESFVLANHYTIQSGGTQVFNKTVQHLVIHVLCMCVFLHPRWTCIYIQACILTSTQH